MMACNPYETEIDPAEWDDYEANRAARDAEQADADQAQYEAWLDEQEAEAALNQDEAEARHDENLQNGVWR